jgi:hypothetical protein
MNKHGEDQSAESRKPDSITATSLKMLGVGMVEAIPLNLPEAIAKWWVGQQGGELLIPETQKLLWNPPNIRSESKRWSRFYKFLFNRDVSFDAPAKMELEAAENWIFIPDEDPVRFEDELQACCARFFPAYKKEPTTGTVGGNTDREGKKYIIRVEQEDAGASSPLSPAEGMEVTLAELLSRELYFYFRVGRRPSGNKMYAVGSLFDDGKVPALRWSSGALELLRCERGAANYRCLKQICTLD